MRYSEMTVGKRVRLANTFDIFPTGIFELGLTGTVVEHDDDMTYVLLDDYRSELDQWDNRLQVNPHYAEYDPQSDYWEAITGMDAIERAARTWLYVLGSGFHLDTNEDDYTPPLTEVQQSAYYADVTFLFQETHDPYGAVIAIGKQMGAYSN